MELLPLGSAGDDQFHQARQRAAPADRLTAQVWPNLIDHRDASNAHRVNRSRGLAAGKVAGDTRTSRSPIVSELSDLLRTFARMDATAWIAAISAVIAVAALYFTWQQARSAQRQTELQQRMHEDAAQPYVWADLRPDAEHGYIISLVVRNEGPTVATDVRVSFDRPVPNKFADEWDGRLVELASLAPGRQMVWWLKPGPDWFAGDEPKAFEISIVCCGPFGPVRQKYRINTEDFGEEQPTKAGSLAAVTKSIDALTKVVKQRRSSAPRAPGAT